jgi:hypothetical protein
MDNFIMGEDIKVMYVTAAGFPEGIPAAHEYLRSLVPKVARRRYFGISAPNEEGKIIYKAAAEETFPGEARNLGLQTFTIRRGAYIGFYIKNYKEDPSAIRHAFDLLLGQGEADPNGYCLEWYYGEDDVKCMVRSADENYPEAP